MGRCTGCWMTSYIRHIGFQYGWFAIFPPKRAFNQFIWLFELLYEYLLPMDQSWLTIVPIYIILFVYNEPITMVLNDVTLTPYWISWWLICNFPAKFAYFTQFTALFELHLYYEYVMFRNYSWSFMCLLYSMYRQWTNQYDGKWRHESAMLDFKKADF